MILFLGCVKLFFKPTPWGGKEIKDSIGGEVKEKGTEKGEENGERKWEKGKGNNKKGMREEGWGRGKGREGSGQGGKGK